MLYSCRRQQVLRPKHTSSGLVFSSRQRQRLNDLRIDRAGRTRVTDKQGDIFLRILDGWIKANSI